MPDQHVTQMDGYQAVPADLPQTVWQMTAPVPTHEVSEPTEQSAPVAAAEQE
jgi:hypothetical protein